MTERTSIDRWRGRVLTRLGLALAARIRGRPTLERPVSQACTADQLDSPLYSKWCGTIRELPRHHRKQWEFCYILQALSFHGAIDQGRRGIGYGVGNEPLVAVFAALGCEVLATDLATDAAASKGWTETNQHATAAVNDRGICDPVQFADRVRFRVVDMNDIPTDLSDFDFTWSACALEHLGSIANGLRFIEESLRPLRPGGIAVHTTEFNCLSDRATLDNGGTVLFRKRDFIALAEGLTAAGHHIKLNFHLGNRPLDRHVDVPPYRKDKHLKLRLADFITTSFGLVIRKSESGPRRHGK